MDVVYPHLLIKFHQMQIKLGYCLLALNSNSLNILSLLGSAALFCWALASFSVFLILYTVGRIPWTGDQPITRPLSTHRATQIQNKHTQTSILPVGFKPTTSVSDWPKTVHVLDRAATVIVITYCRLNNFYWPSLTITDHEREFRVASDMLNTKKIQVLKNKGDRNTHYSDNFKNIHQLQNCCHYCYCYYYYYCFYYVYSLVFISFVLFCSFFLLFLLTL
jgi:hypothetical protein